ncbi:hypothetical protein V1509DRAFT_617487 [Lipomyces kononenkoae]
MWRCILRLDSVPLSRSSIFLSLTWPIGHACAECASHYLSETYRPHAFHNRNLSRMHCRPWTIWPARDVDNNTIVRQTRIEVVRFYF